MNGAISLVRGLSEGVGPSHDRVCGYSMFYKAVVKKRENFVSVTEKKPAKKTGKALRCIEDKTLVGRAALHQKWGDLMLVEVYVGRFSDKPRVAAGERNLINHRANQLNASLTNFDIV